MPSPPPRKLKPTVWLREIHANQLSSLQLREQRILEIIEDIRAYSKQRADIERLYGQSLIKLSSQLLAKKELFQIVEKNPSDEHRTLHAVWKSCLEETEKCGGIRVKAADVYSQTVSERCKVLKTHKSIAVKRAMDQLTSLQNDLSQSVKEFGATHRQYTDDEIIAYEARNKATNADKRLSNKDTGLFSSVNTLKKTQAKSFVKMEQCNSQSTSSRNGYLLELSAVNAHTSRLHTKHIPTLFKDLDDGVYDQLSNCISVIAQTEIDSSTGILSTHGQVVSECDKVTPQYNLSCFLQAHPIFSEQLTFQFEAVQNDPVDSLSIDYNEDQRLEKETRNWARKVAKETRSLADLHDKINQITNKTATPQGSGSDAAMEAELMKLQAYIRRSEIAKLKAEARLELLRTVNMPVDSMLTQATTEHESQSFTDNQSLTSRNSSLHSADTFDSSSDIIAPEPTNHNSAYLSSANKRSQPDNLSTSQDSALSTVIVIYDYQAAQQDELSLTQGELLSILDHGSGDGWLRACNSDSVVGMVPENYIEPYEDTASVADNSGLSANNDANNETVVQQYEQSGQQYEHTQQQYGEPQQYEHAQQQYEHPQHPYEHPQQPYEHAQQQYEHAQQQYEHPQRYETNPPQNVPPTSYDEQVPSTTGIGYVRALYDYEASGEDEISFSADQVITLLSRDVNGIDDGYWKGEVDGVQGMFPSMVVEEMDDLPPPDPSMEPPVVPPTQQQFNTWDETSSYHPPEQHQLPEQHQPPPPPPEPVQEVITPQAFSGSYTQPSTTHNQPYTHFRAAPPPPLPVIPDEDESGHDHHPEPANMSSATELYPSHSSPVVRRPQYNRPFDTRASNTSPPNHPYDAGANNVGSPNRHYGERANNPSPASRSFIGNQNVDSSPPAINRRTKPHVAVPATQHYDNTLNGVSRPVPEHKPKPTVDYSRKPLIDDPPPHPTGPPDVASRASAGPPTTPEKPVGRKFQRPGYQPPVEPAPRSNQPSSATRPDNLGINSKPHSQSDTPDHFSRHHSHYEEINHYPGEGNIRGRYLEVGGGRPHSTPADAFYADSPRDEDVEARKFRQMQPVPHQYYIDNAGGRSGEVSRDKALGLFNRGSDPSLLKERSSSGRSFASLSSSDSQDDKHTPFRIPGRRHLSSELPSDPPTPVTPMSVREASRLMPQGLVNPSYRVATMADMMPSTGAAANPRTPRHNRPTPSRRQGGLPGHVRHGIVQGRKMLSEAASDSADPQSSRRPPPKSETAV